MENLIVAQFQEESGGKKIFIKKFFYDMPMGKDITVGEMLTALRVNTSEQVYLGHDKDGDEGMAKKQDFDQFPLRPILRDSDDMAKKLFDGGRTKRMLVIVHPKEVKRGERVARPRSSSAPQLERVARTRDALELRAAEEAKAAAYDDEYMTQNYGTVWGGGRKKKKITRKKKRTRKSKRRKSKKKKSKTRRRRR